MMIRTRSPKRTFPRNTNTSRLSTLFLAQICICSALADENKQIFETILNNGRILPLVGMGVGNQRHELIVQQVASAPHAVRLIDTARASRNEHLVAQGLQQRRRESKDNTDATHVVTKVWYTHLGYQRTIISVRESLQALQHAPPNTKIHMLLHWSSCKDDIQWMDCEAEEAALPETVRAAGPPPHLDTEHAWKESWRALQDIYNGEIDLGAEQGDSLPTLESIGVSNFDRDEMAQLMELAVVPPSIYQGNVWTYVFDPALMTLLDQHDIHFQAYNVMNGIFWKSPPLATQALETIRSELSAETIAQVVLKWLISNEISIIPRTTNANHLQSNTHLQSIARPTADQQQRIRTIVQSMLQGQDLKPPLAVFHNKQGNDELIHVYWKAEDGQEHPVQLDMESGTKLEQHTFPGHTFLAYNHDRTKQKELHIPHVYGETVEIHIEL